jgi:hypothetical protein
MSCSWSKGGGVENGAIQWEGTMWIRREFVGKEVKPDITQFVFFLVVEVVRMFEDFRGIPDDGAPVLLNLMLCMVSMDCLATTGHWFCSLVSCSIPHTLTCAVNPVYWATSIFCLIYAEVGNCNICQNVGIAPTHDVTISQKLELDI